MRPSGGFLRRVAGIFVAHPTKLIIVAFLPSVISLIVLISKGSIVLGDSSAYDYHIRDDIRTEQFDARRAVLDKFPLPSSKSELSIDTHRTIPDRDYSFFLIFGPVKTLTPKLLADVIVAEDAILKNSGWERFCQLDTIESECPDTQNKCSIIRSVLSNRLLYGGYNTSGNVPCRAPSSQPILDTRIQLLLDEVRSGKNRDSPELISIRGDPEKIYLRSIFPVGLPFQGFDNDEDRPEQQRKQYDAWISDISDRLSILSESGIPTYLIGHTIGETIFRKELLQDLVFAAPIVIFVFLVLWFHTKSLFLSVVAIVQVLFALPLSFVIYTFVLHQEYFAALHIFGVFLILGIGADDVFVFVDTWNQSTAHVEQASDLIERMLYTSRRAVKAVFITSVTTAAAFFVMSASSIIPISTFGFWSGVLILVQFALLITIYPCAIILWERYIRRKRCFDLSNCLRARGSSVDDEAGDATSSCNIPMVRWLFRKRSTREDRNDVRTPTLQKIFKGPWARAVTRFRIPLALAALLLLTASAVLAAKLVPPERENFLMGPDHPLSVAIRIIRNEFSRSGENSLWVKLTWGVLGTDRSSTSRFDLRNPGRVIVDSKFDIKSDAAQRHIFNTCNEFRNNASLVDMERDPEDRVRCWIEDFVAWKKTKGRSDFQNYTSNPELIFDLVSFGLSVKNGAQPYLTYMLEQDVMVTPDLKRVVATEIRITSASLDALPPAEMRRVYEMWQQEVRNISSRAPPTAKRPMATAGTAWVWQATQETISTSLPRSIGIVLGVTFVALSLTTWNIVVALIATISLAGVIMGLLATVYLMGWNLGVIETIMAILSVGYSFDGVAHIAIAYTQSEEGDRISRTRDALETLGISVAFGLLSTALSSSMLLPATVLVLAKLGTLILITMGFSFLWSLILLPAALALLGPQGNFLCFKHMFARLFSNGDTEENKKRSSKSSVGQTLSSESHLTKIASQTDIQLA